MFEVIYKHLAFEDKIKYTPKNEDSFQYHNGPRESKEKTPNHHALPRPRMKLEMQEVFLS